MFKNFLVKRQYFFVREGIILAIGILIYQIYHGYLDLAEWFIYAILGFIALVSIAVLAEPNKYLFRKTEKAFWEE